MARGITISVDRGDLRRLNAAIAEYARVRKVDNAYAVNRTAKDVAFRAVKYTHRAKDSTVESGLKKNISYRYVSKTTGRTLKKPKQSYLPSSLARSVFSNALRKGTIYYKGMPKGATEPHQLGKGKFDALLKKYINMRVSSTEFIRAGFLGAAKAFARFRGGESKPRLKGRRSGKGKGIVAKPGIKSFATLINFATSKSPTSSMALARYASAGATKAIRDRTADLVKFTREQLTKQARKFNRR